MKKKMLQFVDLKQESPEKEVLKKEKVILMRSIMITSLKKQLNNQADVLNVGYLFVKFIVH